MKSNVIFMLCVGLALVYGCGGRTTSGSVSGSETVSALTGNWIEVMPSDVLYMHGFSLSRDGKAGSIGMATLRYEKWKVLEEPDGSRKLVMDGKSIGNGQTLDFSDTLVIVSVTDDSLVLASSCESGCVSRQEYVKTSLCFNTLYSGSIPAADCPGIDVSLTVRDNGTYSLTYDYLERDSRYDSEGRCIIREDLLVTMEDESDTVFYRIEGGYLRMLDRNGQEHAGDLRDIYILKANK